MTYEISSHDFCSTINYRNSFILFFSFWLSSTAFKNFTANILKNFTNLLVYPTQFVFSCAVSKQKSARWVRLARAGSQSERRIHFTLPAGAAGYLVTGDIPQF